MKKLLYLLLCLITISITGIGQINNLIETKTGILHYKIYGSGEPILIISGGPGLDCEGFSPLAKLLSDKYMTILFDQRGTGKSVLYKIDSTTISMEQMAEDIETIRTHLNIDKWIVLGHSFGCFLAQYYAEYQPSPIKALILSSSAGTDLKILNDVNERIKIRLNQTEIDSLNYWNNEIAHGNHTLEAKYNQARFLSSAFLYHKKNIPELAKKLSLAINYPMVTELIYKDLHKINFNCKETLKDFTKPVLIIQGREDFIGEDTARETDSVFINSSLVFIDECGHYCWWEQKNKYKSAIEKFISSINRL